MTPILVVEIGERQIASLIADDLHWECCAVLKFLRTAPGLPSHSSKSALWIGPLTAKFEGLVTEEAPTPTDSQKAAYLLRKVADLIEREQYKDNEDSFSGPLLEVMGQRLEARNAK